MGPSFVTAVAAIAVTVDVVTQLLELPRFKPATESTINFAATLNHFIDFHFTRQTIVVAVTATFHQPTKTF